MPKDAQKRVNEIIGDLDLSKFDSIEQLNNALSSQINKIKENTGISLKKPILSQSAPVAAPKASSNAGSSETHKSSNSIILSKTIDTKSEKTDFVKYTSTTVEDNSKAVGTSGIHTVGVSGYTEYKYQRTIISYSDGRKKIGKWQLVSKNIIAPVNEVKWIGTNSNLPKSGYVNINEAKVVAEEINKARETYGIRVGDYQITDYARYAYENYWKDNGLTYIGNPNECTSASMSGEITVKTWLSDNSRSSILSGDDFVVSCFTDSDGKNWFIYYSTS